MAATKSRDLNSLLMSKRKYEAIRCFHPKGLGRHSEFLSPLKYSDLSELIRENIVEVKTHDLPNLRGCRRDLEDYLKIDEEHHILITGSVSQEALISVQDRCCATGLRMRKCLFFCTKSFFAWFSLIAVRSGCYIPFWLQKYVTSPLAIPPNRAVAFRSGEMSRLTTLSLQCYQR
jgi:hypothetical protein